MKYYDQQAAAIGDTFTIGHFGTCRIVALNHHFATVKNTITGETFELGDLSEADLVTRARNPLQSAIFAAESVAHLRGFEREILPLADLARGQARHIEELEAALTSVLRECVTVNGFPDKGKGRTEDQQAAYDQAREVLATSDS